MMNNAEALDLVLTERHRQDELHGIDFRGRTHEKWFSLAMEEAGETIQAINDHDLEHAKKELVQTIATFMSWLEHGEF